MINRQQIEVAINDLKRFRAEQLNQQANEQDLAMVNAIRVSADESSMIRADYKPMVDDMISRLKSRYKAALESQGGVDGVLRDLESFVIERRDEDQKRNSNDSDKQKQYDAMLRLFNHSDSHFNVSNDATYWGHGLRELLAYMWLSAKDKQSILRLANEQNLHKIENAEGRIQERATCKIDALTNNFLPLLLEIRRAHSGDRPEWERDKDHDRQSCVMGAFGRMILKGDPLSAITTLTPQPTTADVLDQKILNIVESGVEPFEEIPKIIEEYLLKQLREEKREVKIAVFRCIHFLRLASVDALPEKKEPEYQEVLNQFNAALVLYKNFCSKISSDEAAAGFLSNLNKVFKNYFAEQNPEISAIPYSLYSLFTDALTRMFAEPEKFETIYLDITSNGENDRFLERLRTTGAQALEREMLEELNRNDRILAIRGRIHKLSEKIKAAKHVMTNDIKMGVLAVRACINQPENKPKWNEIINDISQQLQTHRSFLQEFKSEFDPLLKRLKEIVNENQLTYTQTVPCQNGFSAPLLANSTLIKYSEQYTKTGTSAEKMLASLLSTTDSFLKLSRNYIENENITPEQVRSGIELDNRFFDMPSDVKWGAAEAWAHAIISVLRYNRSYINKKLSEPKQLELKQLTQMELKKIKDLLESVCPSQVHNIDQPLSLYFHKMLYDSDVPMHTWEDILNQIQTLISVFDDFVFYDFKKVEEAGRQVLAEDSESVFRAADTSLVMISYDRVRDDILARDKASSRKGKNIYTMNEEVDELFPENYQTWYKFAALLLNCLNNDMQMSDFLKQDSREELAKLTQLVTVTVFKNLKLTLIRKADIEAIKSICNLYIMSSDSKEGRAVPVEPMFNLEINDKVSVRLHYLAIHLSCMITTLKYLSSLYNTGHVRIMNSNVAYQVYGTVSELEKGNNRLTIMRTSVATPTTISFTSLSQDNKILSTRVNTDNTVPLTPIHTSFTLVGLPEQVKNYPFKFMFLGQEKLKEYCNSKDYNSPKGLILVSFDKALELQRNMEENFATVNAEISEGYVQTYVSSSKGSTYPSNYNIDSSSGLASSNINSSNGLGSSGGLNSSGNNTELNTVIDLLNRIKTPGVSVSSSSSLFFSSGSSSSQRTDPTESSIPASYVANVSSSSSDASEPSSSASYFANVPSGSR